MILKEPLLEPKAKKSKKRKQRSVVTPISNKKAKPNFSNTISTVCDTTIDSAEANKSKRFLNLQSFTFSKSKLTNDTIKSKSVEVDQHFVWSKINSKNYLNITDNSLNGESINTTTKQFDKNSTLVQSKLTQYFTQRKNIKDKSLTMQSVQSDAECDNSKTAKHIQDKSEVTLDKTLETTLVKYQRILKERDLEFDKLKESHNKQGNEQDLIVINNTPGRTTPDSVVIRKECVTACNNLQENEADSKIEREPIVQTTLRATTPDLYEISAFLDTQTSRQSNEETQRSKTGESLEVLANGQTSYCAFLNGTPNSVLLNTQNSGPISEELQNSNTLISNESPTLTKTQHSISGISNNGEQLSILLGRSKDKTINAFNSFVVNAKILNCGISNMMQKEFVKSSYIPSDNEQPLDLSRKSKALNSPYEKDVKYLKPAKKTLKTPQQHTPSTTSVKRTKDTRSHLQNPEESIGVLDLSRKTETNLNISWCDSKAVDEVSAGSITLTTKSSDTLRNSPKSIENYILCYKVATAFARLNEKERTIGNFKNLYKRVWRTNSAIDYITYKLSHSCISHDEEQKALPKQKSMSRREVKSDLVKNFKENELPLNMCKKLITEKQAKNVLNVKPTASVLRSKSAKNNEEKVWPKESNKSSNQDTSAMFPNRYRLQLLNEVNSEIQTARHINNEVMHLVLDMKCKAIGDNEGNQPLQNLDYKVVAAEADINETQSLPSMSFEEYCSYVLQTPTKQ